MKKRILKERKSYSNEIVGECLSVYDGVVLTEDEIVECIRWVVQFIMVR